MQPRADFVSPNPHGRHLLPLEGVERLAPAWEAIWNRMATPNAVSQNMAEAGLIRQCLRGEPTCLDLRSLFVIAVCVLVCTHGSGVRFRLLVARQVHVFASMRGSSFLSTPSPGQITGCGGCSGCMFIIDGCLHLHDGGVGGLGCQHQL